MSSCSTASPSRWRTSSRPIRRLAAEGRARQAGRQALRLAVDLAQAERPDDAGHVRAVAVELLPPANRRTWSERIWLSRLEPGGPMPALTAGPRRSARVTVRVLGPEIEATVDGEPVELTGSPARLLLALILAQPAPLHIEMVSDLLWPCEELRATRGRINQIVHRLRRALGDAGPRLVRRHDVLALDVSGIEVDLLDVHRALEGPPEEQRLALLSVRGNLCSSQFPYDELFVAERHRFCATWLGHARRLVTTGTVDPEELDAPLTALGLDRAELIG